MVPVQAGQIWEADKAQIDGFAQVSALVQFDLRSHVGRRFTLLADLGDHAVDDAPFSVHVCDNQSNCHRVDTRVISQHISDDYEQQVAILELSPKECELWRWLHISFDAPAGVYYLHTEFADQKNVRRIDPSIFCTLIYTALIVSFDARD